MNNVKCSINDIFCKCDCNSCDKYQPDWKLLDIDNFKDWPDDFFKKECEIEVWIIKDSAWRESVHKELADRGQLIQQLISFVDDKYRYRPIQEIAPTHKEILEREYKINGQWHQIYDFKLDNNTINYVYRFNGINPWRTLNYIKDL